MLCAHVQRMIPQLMQLLTGHKTLAILTGGHIGRVGSNFITWGEGVMKNTNCNSTF